jgi:hypothetical protein
MNKEASSKGVILAGSGEFNHLGSEQAPPTGSRSAHPYDIGQ